MTLGPVAVLSAILVAALPFSFSQDSQQNATEMSYCNFEKMPAEITELRAGDGIAGINVKNLENSPIMSYRIAYFIDGTTNRKSGNRIRLDKPLKKGATVATTLEGLTDKNGRMPKKMVFFITEIDFWGESWLSPPLLGENKFKCVEHPASKLPDLRRR
jgi:hypothetical protein